LAAKYDPSIAGTGLAVTAHFCCAMLLKQVACLQLQAGNKKAILDRYYPLFLFNHLLQCSKPLSYPILLFYRFSRYKSTGHCIITRLFLTYLCSLAKYIADRQISINDFLSTAVEANLRFAIAFHKKKYSFWLFGIRELGV
jgi:hypothetical protein